MRILWLSHFVPYPSTGHGALQRTHHLLAHAAKRHEIAVVALGRDDDGARDLAREATRALAPQLASLDIVPLARGPAGSRRLVAAARALASGETYWEHWFHSPEAQASVTRRLEEFEPELLYVDTVLLASYLRLVRDLPLVVTHHNIESDLYAQRAAVAGGATGRFLAQQSARLALVEQRVATRAMSNVMVSEADAERLGSLVEGASTTVVPNGVDTEFFRAPAGVVARPGSLVFVGGMDWYPNRIAMEWLARELWPALTAAEPSRTMTVVGRMPPVALRALAKSDDRVSVTGFVPDVRPYMAAAAAYICPITVGGGTRLKILDALSMGRPLVSTAMGVSGLGLREGEHFLRAERPGDFAQQVARLEADPALALRLGEAGRAFVETHHGWNHVGERFAECLEAACVA